MGSFRLANLRENQIKKQKKFPKLTIELWPSLGVVAIYLYRFDHLDSPQAATHFPKT